MAAVLPSHGSGSSDVSCCPPLRGMHPDDRSSSSYGSVEAEGAGSTSGDSGGLIQCVSDLMIIGCRSSKDVRSFCFKVGGADVVPSGTDDPNKLSEQESIVAATMTARSSTDPRDSSGLLLHSSPTSDACCFSLKSRGCRRSSGEQHFHSRSGYHLHKTLRSLVFLMMLIVILSFHSATATNVIKCYDLNLVDATHENFLTCRESLISFKKINNTYPMIDISNFTQEIFNEFVKVKGDTSSRRFGGNLRVIGSVLDSITIRLYSEDDIPKLFELKSNPILTEVDVSGSDILQGQIRFNIRGNKILSNSSLEAMKALNFLTNDSYIQDFGECDFEKNPVNSLDDLEHCHYVVGDLIVNDKTDLNATEEKHKEITKTLTSIERGGCLKIINSDLENLRFLENFQDLPCGEIEGNKKLCLHPQELKELKQRLGAKVSYKDNQDCVGKCSPKYLMDDKDTACVIITDTLTITGVIDSDDLKYLHQVKEIKGQLIIRSNDFTDLNFFPNLETVDAANHPGDAIEIRFNNKMTSIDFPKLKKITFTNRAFVYQNDHPMNRALEDRLRKDYNDKVYVHKEKVAEIQNVTANHTQVDEVSEESSGGLGVGGIAGISAAAVVLIIAIIVVAVVPYFWYKAKLALRYDSVLRTNLNLSDNVLVVYPFPLEWMPKATKIIKDNEKAIVAQETKMEKLSKNNKAVFFYRNREAVAPFYSRLNKKINTYKHILGKKEGKCQAGCANDGEDKHVYCTSQCECDDYGVVLNDQQAFGVRMEESVDKWKENEVEFIHEPYFQNFAPNMLPIVYEQTFAAVTAKRMQALPNSMIADEKEYLRDIADQHPECFIYGTNLKFHNEMQEKAAKKRREEEAKDYQYPDRGCSFKNRISIYYYEQKKNSFTSLSKIRTLSQGGGASKGLSKKFFEHMIQAHMNAPVNRWVVNYSAKDFIGLCNATKEKLGNNAFIHYGKDEFKWLNSRIIGEIRGQFDDLRRGLCLPSVNAEKDTHPICTGKHIFLGNYVGPRGSNMEVLCLLFALKCRYPNNYTLLRGALDWAEMEDVSGLKAEVTYRFPDDSVQILEAIYDVFSHLPLACELGDNVLCVHAGLPPTYFLKDQLPINQLQPDTTAFNMMFAQPNYTVKRFFDNVEQKAGYYFGQMVLSKLSKYDVIFCTKVLKSGFGFFDSNCRLISLCGFQFKSEKEYHIAQAEYSTLGELTFQVIVIEKPDPVEWKKKGDSSSSAVDQNKSLMSQPSLMSVASLNQQLVPNGAAPAAAEKSTQQQQSTQKSAQPAAVQESGQSSVQKSGAQPAAGAQPAEGAQPAQDTKKSKISAKESNKSSGSGVGSAAQK